MTPHPSTEDIHLAGPGQVRRAPPLRRADREPADPNALPPLAASGRDHPTRGSRRSAGPSTCVRSTDTGPGRYGPRGAGPAARPRRYGRRSALRQDAAVHPCRRPRPCHQIPRAVGTSPSRRTTTGARLRPESALVPGGTAGVDRPPGSAPHRPQGHGACRHTRRSPSRTRPPPPGARRMPPLNDRTH